MNHTKIKSILLMVFWAIFLFLSTWSQSLREFITFSGLSFRWVSSPDLLAFFNFTDIAQFHQFFILVKTGHFIGFAIMDLLLFNVIKKHKTSVAISIGFAFLTEILQLFFGRDGRLFDIMIDSLGILSVYFFLKKGNRK